MSDSPSSDRKDDMGTTIFYYTGTGNSLWVARKLSDKLGGTEPVSISTLKDETKAVDADAVGLVFPVYIWGVPAPVIRCIDKLDLPKTGYVFSIAVNAGQVSNTLVQLKKILAQKGIDLSTGFEVKMPSNYIPWGGPGAKEKQHKLFELAERKITGIAAAIKGKQHLPVEKGPLWQRIFFTAFYKMTFNQVPKMDGKFRVDDKCNECGICGKVCPAANITMREGRPFWNHRCDQCFSCLQWCPQEAIQYGKKTPAYERYHHPEVRLKDILKTK